MTTPHEPSPRGHETSDADFKSVLLSGVGLFGLMIAGLLLSAFLYSLYRGMTAQPGAHPDTFTQPNEARLPATPRLQADPHAALVALRRAEDSVLTSYGWNENDSTLVRVPIARAMDALAVRGLPTEGR